MTKNEFKIGDKVRVKSTDIEDIVIDVCNGNVFLKESGYWNMKTLELVEQLDRKTAFLTELQALLRKYDATIYGGLSETHNDDVIFVSVGDDDIAYRNGYGEEYANITADNIMEFGKE